MIKRKYSWLVSFQVKNTNGSHGFGHIQISSCKKNIWQSYQDIEETISIIKQNQIESTVIESVVILNCMKIGK